MQIRQPIHPDHAMVLDTEELRAEFLVERVFVKDQISLTYSHVDRIIVGGVYPVTSSLLFDEQLGGKVGGAYLLERRELGLINLGGSGRITADGKTFELDTYHGLYLGKGTQNVTFESADSMKPAMFYLACTPAHKVYPSRTILPNQTITENLGAPETCNCRTINKYFHPEVLPTCQLSLGLTRIATGSNWNTMPTHTHERRMEVYFYTEMSDESVVFHFMGEPSETRHIVARNHQAVISPSWSIHSGVGTGAYAFIWAMAGENQQFDDMDFVDMKDLK
ncbi:MAG: 5-dehydro-4-deoxy-D-glucuronate isomerase [Desulfobulbaceae bacterium]|nr:MAG: 5-dehydro-4-deoxy-D-glucuronate isomerase [Desulfobulbaceae bacterium]